MTRRKQRSWTDTKRLLGALNPQKTREITKIGLAAWQLLHPTGKYYVYGKRIHHYAIGAGTELAGELLKMPQLVAIGQVLKKDDIADKDEAFLFLTKEQEADRAQAAPPQ
jgi:hypothetical protein